MGKAFEFWVVKGLGIPVIVIESLCCFEMWLFPFKIPFQRLRSIVDYRNTSGGQLLGVDYL
ncbi:hypothetical protein L873DRAFT_1809050 [Choiromyces venosus 120613-1]|uniref:Uncharacterized protein n=1 Tax=Choiromyces venosus 120613-1 TaxID=1336337 RepID=A0A3N4JLR0_9PEZI|nr:hypothetical protein L873DRAFT_1809050 [Choiromyces venosus 120613-1]